MLTCGSGLLVYLRDDFQHIPFPGCWDLPGGGREGAESAPECALRELHEEFGLCLSSERLLGRWVFPVPSQPGGVAVFYTGRLSRQDIAAIRFGDEGQYWRLMPVTEYVVHARAVPHFRGRVAQCLGLPAPLLHTD
ncbi:NUDIX domain-containing protein [Paracoccus aurantiacus]|uniref:NUDIX domain-containing protein n=1 Tax=Paracoccus aurantiacus TaxID=2599412 RepID=A0A5C6S0E9_9RHOB|nr:NUDIX domain-containing protein [Paracoccus aurantiacus]